MEDKSLLEKIKSKYIIQNIVSFINDDKILLKLLLHSKSSQEKYSINILKYKETFFHKRIKFENYLKFYEHSDKSEFNKKELKKDFKEQLSEYNINDDDIFKNIVIDYFRNISKEIKKVKLTDKNLQLIDIYSPFFDFLSKTELFDEFFTIQISFYTIKECNLEKEYISKFKKMNKLNTKYSSLFLYFRDLDDINNIKDFQINFSQLKKIDIEQSISFFPFAYEFPKLAKKYASKGNTFYLVEKFVKILFPLINTASNLVYLSIKLDKQTTIKTNSFEFINNFKFLEDLKLNSFKFESTFILKIYSLKNLDLENCKNIEFAKDIQLKLKSFTLRNTKIGQNIKLSFPELEEITLSYYDVETIDIKSLKKLRKFEGDVKIFFDLESPLLEEITLDLGMYYGIQKKIFENICEYKFLKKINLKLDYINDEQISKIEYKNTSVKEMNFDFIRNKNGDTSFYSLQNIFPNLTDLFIKISAVCFDEPVTSNSKITNNSNCKIKNLKIRIRQSQSFQIYCQALETLESVDFDILAKQFN